jgi:uncharacterized membrane protein (UPF0127 family)
VARAKLIVNSTRGSAVCDQCVTADGRLRGMRELMGQRALPPGEGMLLRPPPAIHTVFARSPIDLLFLDTDMKVMKVVDRLRPWRTASQRGAHAVLVLAAGERAHRGVQVGDRLGVWDARPPEEQVPARPAFVGRPVAREGPVAITVLLIASDPRFRTVVSALLARRGCTVSVSDTANFDLVTRERADVVIIEAGRSLTAAARTAATLDRLIPPVGVVIVADEVEPGLINLPVLPKWGPFEQLFAAVERAYAERGYPRSIYERG